MGTEQRLVMVVGSAERLAKGDRTEEVFRDTLGNFVLPHPHSVPFRY